ncbi:MAG TPA: hypothetical protein VF647_09155 [Longimicrobium sp.]
MPPADPLPHSRFRAALRVAAGILGFCVLAAFGATVLAATREPNRTGMVVALAAIFAAYASLHWGLVAVMNRPATDPQARLRRHLRACRVTLGIAAFVEIFLLSGLPVPRSFSDLGAHLPHLALLAATVGAAVLLRRSPRAAHALLLAASAWCFFVVARLVWALGHSEVIGPAYAVVSLLIFSMVAGIWFALWAFRRVRPLLDTAR